MARRRTKALAYPVADLAGANDAIRRIGELERRLATLDAKLKQQTADVKARAESAATPLKEELKDRINGLHAYCESHRKELTRDGRTKSAKLAAGTVGWAFSTRVALKDPKAVLARLVKAGDALARFVRTKHEINKDAMLAEPAAAETVEGVSILDTESFYVKPAELELAESAAS